MDPAIAFLDLTVDDDVLIPDEAFARKLQDEFYQEDLAEEDYDDDVGKGRDFNINVDAREVNTDVNANACANYTPSNASDPFPERVELNCTELSCGPVTIGDVVELKDDSGIALRQRRYGDFLLIINIVEDLETGNVSLRGFRLRRCTRLAPLFNGKLNDLVMMMEVNRYDKRTHHDQGLTDWISVVEVIGKRICNFTHLSYEQMGLRSRPTFVPARFSNSTKASADYVFHQGSLYCRWVYVSIKEPGGKPYGGEARRLYKREVKEFQRLSQAVDDRDRRSDSLSSPGSPLSGDFAEDGFVMIDNPQGKRCRSSSVVECQNHTPSKRRSTFPPSKFTFADFFCGAGGASFGAVKAGYAVKLGVEIDEDVMKSFHRNHPGAIDLTMDAHQFPSFATRQNFQVDHIHFSTTCKYYAICHTRPGKDDQKNAETIFTVAPTLKVLKPAYATAEQAPGMILLRKHRDAFRTFMNTIIEAGYNIRYQVVDLASHGLPQRRRRLLFNMSKIGYPLAPFPNPTNGPKGSGLERYVVVKDVLEKLERITGGVHGDPLHQLGELKRYNVEPYNPSRMQLKGCLTTNGGGNNYHYSGKRKYSARENSLFQTFPLTAHFNGTPTKATEQIGNAYPPTPASQHFLSCAQTHEAFEAGFIDAEEEIHDLWETLNEKSIHITSSQHRYLNLLQKNPAHFSYVPPSIWAKEIKIEVVSAVREGTGASPARLLDRARMRRQQVVLAELKHAKIEELD